MNPHELNKAIKALRWADLVIFDSRWHVGGYREKRYAKRFNNRAHRRLDRALVDEQLADAAYSWSDAWAAR